MKREIFINRIPKRVSLLSVGVAALLMGAASQLSAQQFSAAYETALLEKNAAAAGQAVAEMMTAKTAEPGIRADQVMEYTEEVVAGALGTQDEAVIKWVSAAVLKGAGSEYFQAARLGSGVAAQGTAYSATVNQVGRDVGRLMGVAPVSSAAILASVDPDTPAPVEKEPFRFSFGTPDFLKVLFETNDSTYKVTNRASVQYDDNIDSRKNKKSGMIYSDRLTLSAKVSGERSTMTLRYSPSYSYRPQREDEKHQLYHDLGLLLTHAVSPRLLLRLDETFQYRDQPALKNNNAVTREEQTYYSNIIRLSADTVLRDNFRLTTYAGNTIKRYDEKTVAERHDYTLWNAGLDLSKELKPNKTIGMLSFDASTQDYDESKEKRGHNAYRATVGISQTFNPNLSAEAVGGVTLIDNDSDVNKSTVTAPYGRLTMNYSLSPRTVLTAATGYSFNEDSDEGSYASSVRTDYVLGLRHELTAKVSLSLSASYQEDDYSSDFFVPTPGALVPVEGKSKYARYQARVFYRINRKHTLDAGYNFTDLKSDVPGRDDWDRHQVDMGWTVNF